MGRVSPASPATWPELPATASPTRSTSIAPRVVSTPVTQPPSMRKPTTSQSCTMSTPRASAARA